MYILYYLQFMVFIFCQKQYKYLCNSRNVYLLLYFFATWLTIMMVKKLILLFQTPKSEEAWLEIAKVFSCRWNFPNCIGALDGKRIRLRKPKNSGSTYINYKGFCSISLMALVDGNYRFIFVDVGAEGKWADGGVWGNSDLSKAIKNKEVNIPPPTKLVGKNEATPFCIVADDAFAMGPHLLKPYSRRQLNHTERIFNYRLSRARRCSENAFGIMASRFRIFLGEINTSVEDATDIVLAACCLHNMLRERCGASYIPSGSVDHEDANMHLVRGDWRRHGEMVKFDRCRQKNPTTLGKRVRTCYEDYFNTPEGSVPWQNIAVYGHE